MSSKSIRIVIYIVYNITVSGIEPLLREAGKLNYVVDEAYAALRDLNCEVKMVKLQTNEKGEIMQVDNVYEEFGSITSSNLNNTKKLNFNPVYDDTPNIDTRIQNESKAPFAKPSRYGSSGINHYDVIIEDDEEDGEDDDDKDEDDDNDNNNTTTNNVIETDVVNTESSCCGGSTDHNYSHDHQH